MTHVNWFDFVAFAILGISVVLGLLRGFVREFIALVVLLIAVSAAAHFSEQIANNWLAFIKTPSARQPIAFVSLFLLVWVLGAILNQLVGKVVAKAGISFGNRLLGMIFGIARGIFIVGFVIMLLVYTPAKTYQWWSESILIPYFDPLVQRMEPLMPLINFQHIQQLTTGDQD